MNPILSAFLIVGGIGLVCSILLVLATYFFKIEKEEMIKNIRDSLPGANCGACGYSGCDLYAAALARGECEPNLCVPGSVAVAEKLSTLLGVSVKADEPKVAYVKCHGNCASVKEVAVCDSLYSCRQASNLYGGPKACLYSCLGCGDCADACPTSAICVKDGIAHINPVECIGCGMCVKECPRNLIVLLSRESKVAVMCNSKDKGAVARKNCDNACIACKKCENNCPEGAIKVIDNLATIDYDKCTGCGKCHEVCPTGCIHLVDLKV